MAYAGPTGHPMPAIHEAINESKLATLEGNTRPEMRPENDRGVVADSLPLEHLQLRLKRTPEAEAELATFIDSLHDRTSANYHKWLTPGQFAEHYGVAKEDVEAVSRWLESKGFTVNGVQPTGLTIDFSGTAGLVRTAFRTEIHNLEVNGVAHIANVSDPKIPAALAPAVSGIVSLNDFRPRPLYVKRAQSIQRGQYNTTNDPNFPNILTPGDIQTIYNFTPAYQAGLTGTGQKIMLLEDTFLYSTADWTTFRKTFNLTRTYPKATLTQIAPTGASACTQPAPNGDDGEAIIDVEWATAAAPNAAIVLAACSDPRGGFGGLNALENVLNGPAGNLPAVVSMSYGEAEASTGATLNAAFNTTFQQAVTEGVSIFVSSGDENAASADGGNPATHGISISGWTSSQYDVSVGGTDFADGYLGNSSTYWSATNASNYSSALSYIPEIPWNDSCAGALIASFLGSTPLALCNSTSVTSSSGALNGLFNAVGGSGGPSGCATGTASTRGVVSGTCAGYPKPSYQAGIFGNPNDGVRDIPDVSLFASNGFWGTYYVVCWSDPRFAADGSAPCTGTLETWAGFGGTSVSSPIMAAIQALINEKTGERWGNPNVTYYALANAEYGPSGNSACNSETVNPTSNTCAFYDITLGDNVSACEASGATLRNCYRPSGTVGVLSTSNTVEQPAYTTTPGWDFPTGIGSVNVWNLLQAWPTP